MQPAVYEDKSHAQDAPFEDYINKQKSLLEENYKVIIGRNPVTSEETFEVNGIEGTILRGYAWWGDIAFIRIPEKKTILAFVKTEANEGDFEDIFMDILSTIEW